jgi:fatty acid desaturase
VHHLFPRVPHYRLPALWADVADDMVAKGVRSEGGAIDATGPIVW